MTMPDTRRFRTGADDALLVIDVQRGFTRSSALAVPDSNAIVPTINTLARRFANIVISQGRHAGRRPARAGVDTGLTIDQDGQETVGAFHRPENPATAKLRAPICYDLGFSYR